MGIQKDNQNGFYYITDGFMAIVARRFRTEKRAIAYAKKNYKVDLASQYRDIEIPNELAEIVENYA